MKTIQSYGCVKCQTRHYETDAGVFRGHIMFQSKHGVRDDLLTKELKSELGLQDPAPELTEYESTMNQAMRGPDL